MTALVFVSLYRDAMLLPAGFTHRVASLQDVPLLKPLMEAAIGTHLARYLTPEGVHASRAIMGLDSQLIADKTYFVVMHGQTIAASGGWSRRATEFGGDHSPGRDAALVDPRHEPARVRAMYTHPEFARQGLGRFILQLCESAAKKDGFTRLTLVATLSGFPLYRSFGFAEVERFEEPTASGVAVPLIRMQKTIA